METPDYKDMSTDGLYALILALNEMFNHNAGDERERHREKMSLLKEEHSLKTKPLWDEISRRGMEMLNDPNYLSDDIKAT